MSNNQNIIYDRNVLIHCKHNFFSNVLQKHKYALVFKTTNFCWNNCAHCCESSGPSNSKEFIPETTIKQIIDNAVCDDKFTNQVVFTGGEIMSSYMFGPQQYFSNIINYALDKNLSVDFKTNAGWVNMPKIAKKIYSDIENIMRRHRQKASTNYKKIIFNVSLSLDSFHHNAMQRDIEFIKHFANTNIPGVSFSISVSSLRQDKNMFNELLQNLNQSGINIHPILMNNSNNIPDTPSFDLNNNVLLSHSYGTLFNGGRAKNIPYAKKTLFPQFVFLSDDLASLIAFDSFGNVTLGENSGKKISTPWHTPDGTTHDLQSIRNNLTSALKNEEAYIIEQYKQQHPFKTYFHLMCHDITRHI